MLSSSIVHHLSGPNTHATTQTSHNRLVSCWSKHTNYFLQCATKLNYPKAHTCIRLLGPCFKTGRMKPFSHSGAARKVTRTQPGIVQAQVPRGTRGHDPTYICSLKVNPTRRIHTPGDVLPCPKSCPHHQTDGDTQGKKHHTRSDQNQQHHLR